jgi:hypothetical protein
VIDASRTRSLQRVQLLFTAVFWGLGFPLALAGAPMSLVAGAYLLGALVYAACIVVRAPRPLGVAAVDAGARAAAAAIAGGLAGHAAGTHVGGEASQLAAEIVVTIGIFAAVVAALSGRALAGDVRLLVRLARAAPDDGAST